MEGRVSVPTTDAHGYPLDHHPAVTTWRYAHPRQWDDPSAAAVIHDWYQKARAAGIPHDRIISAYGDKAYVKPWLANDALLENNAGADDRRPIGKPAVSDTLRVDVDAIERIREARDQFALLSPEKKAALEARFQPEIDRDLPPEKYSGTQRYHALRERIAHHLADLTEPTPTK